MKLRLATFMVRPKHWGEIQQIAIHRGLNRSAYLRFLISEAIRKAHAEERKAVAGA